MTRNLRLWSLGFLVPATALYLFIVIVPSIRVVNDGFFDWRVGQTPEFVGLGNYRELLGDSAFIDSAWHTLALLVGALVIQIPMGFLFALLIHRGSRAAGFFQTVFFVPMVLSSVVIAVLWTQVYQGDFGLLNTALRSLGLGGLTRSWLGDTDTSLGAVIVVVGWQYVGLYMLIFLAAMQRIPRSIYEAGWLDGATGWSEIRSLTIPMLSDSIKLSVILVVTGSVQYFNLIWAMTMGGPAGSSSVLASFMYERAFLEGQLGYASSVATVMLVLNLLLAIGLQRLFKREPIEFG